MNMNHPRGCVRFWAAKIRACLIGTKPNRIHIFFREHRSLFGVAPGTRGLVSFLPGGLATFVRATSAPFIDRGPHRRRSCRRHTTGPNRHFQTLHHSRCPPSASSASAVGSLASLRTTHRPASHSPIKTPRRPLSLSSDPRPPPSPDPLPADTFPPRTPACIGIARRRHLSLRGRGGRVSPSLLWLQCTPRHAPNGRVVGVHDAKEVRLSRLLSPHDLS